MDDKLFQEWYCGNCSTYIKFRLNMCYDRVVLVVCPMCKHEHQRYIKAGKIQDDGRYNHGDPKEEIHPLKTACSKEPITKKLSKEKWGTRDGIVINSERDLVREDYFRQLWIELHGDGSA
jgi:hypothetical protein